MGIVRPGLRNAGFRARSGAPAQAGLSRIAVRSMGRAAAPGNTLQRGGWRLAALAGLIVAGWASIVVVDFATTLTVLSGLGFLAAVAGLREPRYGLLGVGLLSSLDTLTRAYVLTGGWLRWNTFNYFLAAVLALRWQWVLGCSWAPVRLALGLLSLMVVQLMGTTDLEGGMMHCLSLAAFVGLVSFAAHKRLTPEAWLEVGFLIGVLSAVGGFVYLLKKSGLTYLNPNAYAFFPLSGLFAISCVVPLCRHRPGWLAGLVPLAVINGGWVVLTGSRGGMVIAAFCCLLIVWQLPRTSHRLTAGFLAVAILVFMITRFEEEREYVVHRLDRTLDAGESIAERTSGRSDLARIGMFMFLENPIGSGTGSFALRYAQVSDRFGMVFSAGKEKAAHSAWVKTLVENGAIGFGLFAALVGSFALIGWKRQREGLLPAGLLTSGVLAVAFLSTEFQSKALWFFAATMTAGLWGDARPTRVRREVPARRTQVPVRPLRQ